MPITHGVGTNKLRYACYDPHILINYSFYALKN